MKRIIGGGNEVEVLPNHRYESAGLGEYGRHHEQAVGTRPGSFVVLDVSSIVTQSVGRQGCRLIIHSRSLFHKILLMYENDKQCPPATYSTR